MMNCPGCQWKMEQTATIDRADNPILLYNCRNQDCPYDETITVNLSDGADMQAY